MPTLADVAGYEKQVITDGVSCICLPYFQREIKSSTIFYIWEFPEYGGQLAIRMGDWKVWKFPSEDNKNKPKFGIVST